MPSILGHVKAEVISSSRAAMIRSENQPGGGFGQAIPLPCSIPITPPSHEVNFSLYHDGTSDKIWRRYADLKPNP